MARTLHCRRAGWESQLQAQDARTTKENWRISRKHVAKVAHADRDWAPGLEAPEETAKIFHSGMIGEIGQRK